MSEGETLRQRMFPLGIVLGAAVVFAFLSTLTDDGPWALVPFTGVVIRQQCPNPDVNDPRIVVIHNHIGGTDSNWTTIAWGLLLLTAIVCLYSPRHARRALQLSLLFSSVSVALYGSGLLESVLLGQPYTELLTCKPSPAETKLAVDQANHFRAVLTIGVGSFLLPVLAYIESSESDIQAGSRQWAGARWWSWLATVLVMIVALLTLLALFAGHPELSSDVDTVVKGLVSFPLIILLLTGLAALVPAANYRRAGRQGLQAAAGLAFTNLSALVIIENGHRRWIADPKSPGNYTEKSDLPGQALDNLYGAQNYFAVVLLALALLAVASWLINRLVHTRRELVTAPVLLLAGGVAAPADWATVQLWAWQQGWRTTPSRPHATQMALAGERVLFVDFSPRHGSVVFIGPARLQDDDRRGRAELSLVRYRSVARLQDGGVDFDQVNDALHQQADSAPRSAIRV